jgi:catechol 2,3-dioxygenase-like lactoylglutathione lyase family enzyme
MRCQFTPTGIAFACYTGAMPVKLTKDSIDLGIVVRDIEASLAFYRDTLGFVPAGDSDMGGGGHMWRLLCGTTTIKLWHFEREPAEANPPGGINKAIGSRYWTISVANLVEVVADCEAKGYTIAMPTREIRAGVTIAMIEDPDGYWVELLQIA